MHSPKTRLVASWKENIYSKQTSQAWNKRLCGKKLDPLFSIKKRDILTDNNNL
jgi:hypothetical protein